MAVLVNILFVILALILAILRAEDCDHPILGGIGYFIVFLLLIIFCNYIIF